MATTTAHKRGRPRKTDNRIETINIVTDGFYEPVAFLGDLQVPFQDNLTLAAVERFLADFQPKRLINVGDHIDYYGISAFVTDPKRKLEIQDDIDESVAIWKRWRTILPTSEFIWEDGNHEDRLRKHLWKNDPELAYLRNLEPEKLFGLNELGIKRLPYGEAYYLNPKFIAEHGDIVRKDSAYTAKAMQTDRGISGLSGHTHRLGTYYKRDRSGTYAWYENGTLAQLFGVEYDPFPNWQQGFTVGWFKKSGYRFHLDQIAITDHAFVYAGKRYGIA